MKFVGNGWAETGISLSYRFQMDRFVALLAVSMSAYVYAVYLHRQFSKADFVLTVHQRFRKKHDGNQIQRLCGRFQWIRCNQSFQYVCSESSCIIQLLNKIVAKGNLTQQYHACRILLTYRHHIVFRVLGAPEFPQSFNRWIVESCWPVHCIWTTNTSASISTLWSYVV